MLTEINQLFEMLSWNSNEETQKKGVEEGKKIKYISIFMQPVEDKSIWENCAKIIVSKPNELLETYLSLMFEWLQDANWPGFDIIYNRIKNMPIELIKCSYAYSVKKAIQQKDEMWLIYLASLSENKKLYESLNKREKYAIKKHIKEGINYLKPLDKPISEKDLKKYEKLINMKINKKR